MTNDWNNSDERFNIHLGVKISPQEDRALIALQAKMQHQESRRISASEIVRKALRDLFASEGIQV